MNNISLVVKKYCKKNNLPLMFLVFLIHLPRRSSPILSLLVTLVRDNCLPPKLFLHSEIKTLTYKAENFNKKRKRERIRYECDFLKQHSNKNVERQTETKRERDRERGER